MSEYQRVDTLLIPSGQMLEIGSKGGEVFLWHPGSEHLFRFDADARDAFAKAWAEAERRAEAHGAVT